MPRPSAAAALRGAVLAAACGGGSAWFGRPAAPKDAVPVMQPLCFFALADWGGEQLPPYTTPGQLAVASTMGAVSAQAGSHPSFVLAAGDNYYMYGLPAPLPDAETAARVSATFQDVYTAPGLQVPWYVVAGNHDWVGNITAELRLNGSAATGGRWFMPSTYYTFTRTAPGGDTVQFVMIDTETLTGGANPIPAVLPNLGYPPVAPARRRLAEQRRGGRRLQQSSEADPGASSPLDPPVPPAWVPPPVNEAQWVWIQATLEASTADWIIVVGHHPVWSVGEYGPTWPLVERLAPMMESAGVALYICGHEHQMEHFRSEPHASGVDYLVVGNGAYYNDTVPTDTSHAADCPYGSLQFAYTEGTGFASLLLVSGDAAAPSQLSATLYDGAGDQLYAFYKANPRTAVGHAVGNLGSPPAPPLRASPARSGADSLITAAGLVAVLGGLLCLAGLARDHARGQPPAPRPMGPRDVVRDHMATWAQKQGRGETAPLVRPGDVALSYITPNGGWADEAPESPAARSAGAVRTAKPAWTQR